MENDHGYLLNLFNLAWEASEKGAVVIDLLVALFLVCGVRVLEKRNKLPTFLLPITKHAIFEDDKWRLAMTFAIIFIMQIVFISPYSLYKQNRSAIIELQKSLDDKSPKLNGFIDQSLVATEQGTNSLIFLEIEVGNTGGSESFAENYGLKVTLTNKLSTNADLIEFAYEYTNITFSAGKNYLIDLKRSELISEKTFNAIQPHHSQRGWIAFRLPGILPSQYAETNVVLSFYDFNQNKIYATNGFWKGKPNAIWKNEETTKTMPGSQSIMTLIEPSIETNTGWLPPELPPGCSNVLVFFGANGMNYTRLAAEISPEGTKFAIKDLPDFYLQNLDKTPGYSPRQKYLWIKAGSSYSIGGKTVPYPVQPIIISNRLYVEVEIPFLNEKRKIVMSDDFDPDLPIPPHWDRNYSTNYYANAGVSGGIYAYEVVNELTNPVLQVFYSAPNEVHILGIFKVDENSILASFGSQPMLGTFTYGANKGIDSTQRITTVSLQITNFSESIQFYTNDSISEMGEIFTNEFYRPVFPGQKAIFKYPSNRNLGVFADDIIRTNH